MFSRIIILVCLATSFAGLHAQDHFDAPRGTEFLSLHSEQTGRDYTLLVNLPPSYEPGTNKKYPILYYTDAQWDVSLLHNILGKCYYDRTLPEIITVGISYPDPHANYGKLREWDLTPAKEDRPGGENRGGGPQFLEWVVDDLVPFVESKYPVDPDARAWGGVSLGGFFALYLMYEESELFDRIISISPAIIVDRGHTFRQDQAFAASNDTLETRLFVCYGTEEYHKFSDPIAQYQKTISGRGYKGLELRNWQVEGARHGSVAMDGWTRGLWWAFKDITPDLPGPLEDTLKDVDLTLDLED